MCSWSKSHLRHVEHCEEFMQGILRRAECGMTILVYMLILKKSAYTSFFLLVLIFKITP